MNKSVIITETTLFCYICKPRDIAELHRSLNCWVENHPICMMMSCVGFEVYKFSEPPLLAQQFFQSPPSISSSPPLVILNELSLISNIWKSWKSSLSPIENGKKFELFLPNVRAQGIHEDLWRAILSQGKFNPVEIFSVKKRAKWAKVPALTFLGKVYRTVVLSSNQNNRRKLYVKCGFPCKNKKHAIFARFQKDPQNKTKIDGQVISRILAYWLHNAVPTGAGEGGGGTQLQGMFR